MKALVEGFMSHQPVAYLLFGAGAMIAVLMEMLGQPSLIFALGMYLPLELNTPALVGGFISHLLNKRAEKTDGEPGRRIRERGVIIASGLMAGGALGGVFGAALEAAPQVSGEPDHYTVLRERAGFANGVGAALRWFVPVHLVWFAQESEGMTWIS